MLRPSLLAALVAVTVAAALPGLAGPAHAAPPDQGNGRAHAGGHEAAAEQAAVTRAASDYPVKGIDVSSHDHSTYKTIDWAAQRAAGMSFAYVKATEGNSYINPYFAADNRDAKNAGLLTGAYTFGRPDRGAPETDANYFIDNAAWVSDSRTLIPFLDMEWPYPALGVGTCYNLNQAQMADWVRRFVVQVRARIGRDPMIYTARGWWDQCVGSAGNFGGYRLDVANWNTNGPGTLPAGWSTWTLWQYAEGNNSQYANYDKNVFNGSYTDLKRLAGVDVPGGIGDAQVPVNSSSRLRADFDGDGRDDTALFYDYGGGHVAIWTLNAAGGLSLRWEDANWGRGTKYVVSGDITGDGRSDLALYYDFGDGRAAIYTLTATGGGAFGPPVLRWDAPYWGTGTRFLAAGDSTGDGKSDLALFYDYGGGRVAVFTLTATGDGGFSGPATRWEAASWGTGTKFLAAGDFTGDGKSDLALFYDYGNGGVATFVLPAGGSLYQGWSAPNWGSGTRFAQAGDFTGDGKADLALFYDYGGGHVAVFTLATGGGLTWSWDAPAWGGGTRLAAAASHSGGCCDAIDLFYDYGNSHVTLFTLTPATGTLATRWDRPGWGTGTTAMV
ncbi:GH25 family lysozyme [Longispora albida]|uniref:GH25 family lysozyme n=1 Tax=Longispora albida TaxID=203523 RepID=UPI00036C81D7|nr:GH25 family lysozyme [Longispora albida]